MEHTMEHTNTCKNTHNHLCGGSHSPETLFGLLTHTHRVAYTDRHVENNTVPAFSIIVVVVCGMQLTIA